MSRRFIFEALLPDEVSADIARDDALDTWGSPSTAAWAIGSAAGIVRWRRVPATKRQPQEAVRFLFEVDLPKDIAETISDPEAIYTYGPAIVARNAIDHAVGGITWRREAGPATEPDDLEPIDTDKEKK